MDMKLIIKQLLYKVLLNLFYIGKVNHKSVHENVHDYAIILPYLTCLGHLGWNRNNPIFVMSPSQGAKVNRGSDAVHHIADIFTDKLSHIKHLQLGFCLKACSHTNLNLKFLSSTISIWCFKFFLKLLLTVMATKCKCNMCKHSLTFYLCFTHCKTIVEGVAYIGKISTPAGACTIKLFTTVIYGFP